jgi:phosphoribosylanthranilate isomerase
MIKGVKVCGATSEADIRKAERAGAQSVGVLVRPDATYPFRSRGSHSQNTEKARQLKAAMPEGMGFVLLPRTRRLEEILALTKAIDPDRVQLGQTSSPNVPAAIRRHFGPEPEIAQVIHVNEATKPSIVDRYDVDYIHLDSPGPMPGGNGTTHDWERSAEIAERAHEQGKLVILAGGLTVANVAQAIAIVNPDGVDVETGIRTHGVYNQGLIQRFVDAAV